MNQHTLGGKYHLIAEARGTRLTVILTWAAVPSRLNSGCEHGT
ncbi:hypothetical protein B0G75_14325 [Paraburkholderia sp. BL18I3N2]|nr:hypothetical protein B0G75_14325 [Paraburkholderia sp. BL18I3N2]PRX92671.1 hypothetical protein B0G73_13498 [Paraburkholderia sp. BL25I1N1]